MLRRFIDRPILASVISIVIVIAGLAALRTLPVEQYPDVVPPQVVVDAVYPGASAQVVAEAVAAPLEQEINGVDGMIYMESTSTDAGSLRITVSFEIGTDPDQAAINVNNRVQAAMPKLPQRVRDQGVRVEARSTSLLLVPVIHSPGGTHDTLFISNYALLNIIDELVRLPGVGDASLFGAQDYSMRIWLRPDKMAQYDLTPTDVAAAIREQNAQFAAGRIGAEPASDEQAFTFTVATPSQLADPESFENIILRAGPTGETLRLGDVADAELGAQSYAFSATYNGRPAVPIGVYLQPGANALDTAEAVRGALERLARRFPEDLTYSIPYDTTEFVEISIEEVRRTLIEALALVVLVTFVFLQHVRATLVPVIAIPISLIGTFAGMLALGFSVNLLTLFGLVLAIGIVVDDAIIVMENVERLMREQGLRAREAALRTVDQVAGAVVASTLVLAAVFVPVGFLGGLTGELYRQFAVTISVSVLLSGVVALTLTPAMCALLLDHEARAPWAPFRLFNRGFEAVTRRFSALVAALLDRPAVGAATFAGVIVAAVFLLGRLPSGLVPQEDQGVTLVAYNLPPAAAMGRTEKVRDQLSERLLAMDEVEEFTAFAGFDIISSSLRTNAGVGFTKLAHWDQRTGEGQDAASVSQRMMAMNGDANVVAFVLPPIRGLSLTGGIEGYLQVRSDPTTERIVALGERLSKAADARPELHNARITLDAGIPRYAARVDREKAKAAGVPIDQIFDTLQSTFGSLYVNDFSLAGRNWQVNLQSAADFRDSPDDLRRVFVRSNSGEMVAVSSLVDLEREQGADIVNRFNVYAAAKFMADPAPGYTSGEALAAVEEVAAEIFTEADDAVLGWIGEAYQLQVAAGTGGLAFGLGLLMVFLILAAQYERWSLPLAVATAVPFGVLGASLGALMRGLANDIYFQVGLLVLIGLATKNAILIVEFAAQNRERGMAPAEAAQSAARERFRAIMMTALTFVIGSLPLMFASGAGAASRQAIGTVVVSGMVLASSLALVFVPLAFKLLEDLVSRRRVRAPAPAPAPAPET